MPIKWILGSWFWRSRMQRGKVSDSHEGGSRILRDVCCPIPGLIWSGPTWMSGRRLRANGQPHPPLRPHPRLPRRPRQTRVTNELRRLTRPSLHLLL